MAGIFERVSPQGSQADHNVSIEMVFHVMNLRALGEYTNGEALAAVNESIDPLFPLAGQEVTDLQAILDEMVSQSNNTLRLIYLNKAKAVFHQWEQGISIMSESRGRTVLGIP